MPEWRLQARYTISSRLLSTFCPCIIMHYTTALRFWRDSRAFLLDVTIQISLLLRRLRRQGGGGRRGHPAPRQGALQAPWDSLLNQGCCKIGKRRVLVGVQRATALCRSARGPRFILPARLRRRQQGSLQQPCLLNRYRLTN